MLENLEALDGGLRVNDLHIDDYRSYGRISIDLVSVASEKRLGISYVFLGRRQFFRRFFRESHSRS